MRTVLEYSNDNAVVQVALPNNFIKVPEYNGKLNPKYFGAVADGTLHTVAEWVIPGSSGKFSNLDELQLNYPFVQDLSESIDYVATQAAVNVIKQLPEKFSVIELTGHHVWNRELIIDVPLCIEGGHRVNTIEQLNWTNTTPLSGNYVMIVGDGSVCRTVKTRRTYRGSHTDAHDLPLSAAINIQADGVTIRDLCLFMQVNSALVSNLSSYNLQNAITATLVDGVGVAPNYYGAPQVYTPKAWADVAGAPAKNWDVGVFIGTRLKTTIEACSFAFFENASVYNDITNIASRPLTDWRGNALPANSVSGSDGMTMTKCYTFGSPYGVRVLGALPKSGLVSYGKDYKTSVQLTIAVNPTSGDKLLIGGYDYDRVTNLPASGAAFESTTFTFINSDEEAPTGEVGVVIGSTTAQTAENLVRAITALLDDNDEGVSALIKPLFNYANYSNESGSSVVIAFARGFSNASLARFLNCFEIRHSNPTAFTVTAGQTNLGGGLYKIVPVVGSDPAPYFWGSTTPDFIEDGRGAYGASDMYITECQLFALKRPSISGTPVYVKQIRTDRNWQLNDGGGAAIEIDGLAGNSSRCIQKHFHSKNRVDGQSVLSHIRLGRANAVTLEQCHPDGTVSRPDIYSAAAASYGWLTRTPYTKVTAQVGYGVPRPHPDAARVTDGQYQSVGTTRLGNGGIDGYGALIGTRLRIEVPAVSGGEGRADVIGGNSGTASVRLGTTNNPNTFRLQFFGSSGNGYVRNFAGNTLYEVPTGSYHNFQFRNSTTGTTTSRARLTETSLDLLNGLRLGAIGVGGVLVRSGTGSPEGVLTANVGSIYLRTDGGTGTTLYSKESGTGSVGWMSFWSSAIVNTDALPEGSSSLYHTSQRVRDTTLTGLSTDTATPVTSDDTVLTGIGKLQAQDTILLDQIGALSGTVNSKLSDFINVADFGAVPDGETDCTDFIQAAIDHANLSGGGAVYLNSGVYMISGLTMLSRVSLIGKGQDLTELRMIVGSNQDAIVGTDIESVTLKDLRINGQYLLGEYNEPDVAVGNTSGGGINWSAAAFVLDDVIITNIAGIGLLSKPPLSQQSQYTLQLSIIDCIVGICGKEGIIIRGGFGVGNGDWLMRRAWVGLCGLLPRPLAHTQIAMSDYYPGDPCDGIVIHRANIECGDIHTYANWSGCGFRTRDICRLTTGGRIISESNRSQVQIDEGSYGSAFFDVRFLGTLHPNWSVTPTTYTQPMAEFDGVTINASKRFRCEVTVRNIHQISPRVIGVTGVHVTSSACVNMLYSNSVGLIGDPEAGEFFSGDALLYTGAGASIEADVEDCNGHAIHVKGESGDINFAVKTNKGGGAALHRDSNGSTKFANNIRGTVHRSALAFLSTGTPAIEQISLTINAVGMGETVFDGDPPSLGRNALWHINAAISEDGLQTRSTERKFSVQLDASTTDPQTIVVEHEFLYTPSIRQVYISISDGATPTSAVLQYIVANDIDDTNLTIAYKYSTPDLFGAANNIFANILIL